MGWLDTVRSLWRGPIATGGQATDAADSTAARAALAKPRARSRTRPEQMSHSSQQAVSGYGSNPYDTYTWELHQDNDGDRRLKRASDINRKKDAGGDPTNPYDTGSFKGGW